MTESADVEFLLLGPLEARHDGMRLPLSGMRRRALLARLLLDADRLVSAETLLDDVWDKSSTPAALATLQSHVSQLRKVLGSRVQTRTRGYSLSLAGSVVDSVEFEREANLGTVALHNGEAASAAKILTTALRMWRGRALQDVEDRPWAQAEAARLEEVRALGSEHLLQARLDAGEHEEVVPDAEAAIACDPLRERRWAILIVALYRCGRQADALRAYQRLRQLLADELGIDPSPSLVALESAILHHDESLAAPAGDAAHRPASTSEDPLTRARALATARQWRTAVDDLVATDRLVPLGAEDLELLGDVAFMAGEQEVSITARQRAHFLWLDAGLTARAATAALLIVGNHYVRNRPLIAAGWYHKARRLLRNEPEGSARGVLALMGALIAMAQGQHEAAAMAAADAERIGKLYADRDIEAVGLALHGWALTRLGRRGDGQAMLDESLAMASSGRLGPIATGQICCWSTQALLGLGDLQRAAEWIDSIEASGIAGFPGDCRVHRAEVLRGIARLDEAETEAEAARFEVQAVDLLHAGIAHYELGMIHLSRGEFESSNRYFQHAAACGARVQPGLALLRLTEGNVDEAVRLIDGALLSAQGDPVLLSRLLPAAIQIADAAGESDTAASRMRDLEEFAARFARARVPS